jgi:hypothetical protein
MLDTNCDTFDLVVNPTPEVTQEPNPEAVNPEVTQEPDPEAVNPE